MKINSLQINAFGNIENKKINLSKDKINIIYGKNEAGKSTLLKFIINSFYGISKNKRGKEISDFDKYKPWNSDEFSGKISYTLDNGENYEVFRDFTKKTPKIYNESLEEISNQFSIDKTNGNLFFIEQTKVDENTFLSSVAAMQQEVKLAKQDQNVLLQKIANLVGTGDDKVSYKKAIEIINKKQVEEVGTSRTQGRPINLVKDELYTIQDEIGELEEYKDKKYEIDDEKKLLEEKKVIIEKKLEIAKEIKKTSDEEAVEKQKEQISRDILSSNNKKIEDLKKEKIKIEEDLTIKNEEIKTLKNNQHDKEENKKRKNKKSKLIWSIISIIAIAIALIFIKINKIVTIISSIIAVAAISGYILKQIKINKEKELKEKETAEKYNQLNEQLNTIKGKCDVIESQINLIKDNNREQEAIIENTKNIINTNKQNKINELENKYGVSIKENLEEYNQDVIQNALQENKLKLHTLELDKNNIIPKLDRLAELEENFEQAKEKETALNKKNEAIELAKKMLEIAYTKMKNNVTPKFTKSLSENINQITNGKYNTVRINDEDGIIVEKQNGEYIPCDKLSIGTIDQLYLSLRLGATKEISEENMPIILDESFAYYDDERLENILKYINSSYKDNQIIIFTCTEREKNILNNLKIEYNEISL